jgi:hypothetical protein
MRFSLFGALSLFILFSGSFAAVTPQPNSIAKRQETNAYVTILQGLTAQIIEQDRAISITLQAFLKVAG